MRLATAILRKNTAWQCCLLSAVLFAVIACGSSAPGQQPAERIPCNELVPDTSRLFVSVTDPANFRELWRQTEIGKMFNDEAMHPFGNDLRKQIDERMTQTSTRLGLKFSDLEGIAGGEMAIAMVQPVDLGRFYVVMLADVRGREQQVADVSKKIRKELEGRGGKSATIKLEKYEASEWTFAATAERPEMKAYFATHDDWYVSSDHKETLLEILHRIDGHGNNVLAKLPTYQEVMKGAGHANEPVQLQWFIDPFGLAESVRAADQDRERGRDRVKVWKEQGFGAIEAVGGVVFVAANKYDFVFRTYVHAPEDKRVLAARMLTFPNDRPLEIPAWARADFSGFTAFNWDMQTAFNAAAPLVNAMAAQEGVFESALEDIATDPHGLQIDVKKEIVAKLGTRIYMATETDNKPKITPQSEQRLVAIELKEPEQVFKTLKALKKDPTIKEREVVLQDKKKHLIWEIQSKANAKQAGQQGFKGFRRGQAGAAPNPQAKKSRPLFKNGALTVAHGHLIYSSDVKFLSDFLVQTMAAPPQHKPLSGDAELKQVQSALDQLEKTVNPFMSSFVRLDEALEPNYELFRANKMPQNESFLGQLLNSFLAPEDEDVARKQMIDGSQLPEYSDVRQYMRPAGFKAYSVRNGWRIVGCVIARENRAAARSE